MTKIIKTPWGKAQDITEFRKGFAFYTTASHGGYHLNKMYNEIIPTEYRSEEGWYEEDGEALIVAYFHSEIVKPFSKQHAKDKLEEYLSAKIED